MFGYIVLSGNNASTEDKKTYREFYCGLCHVLKEKYGKAGTTALSYDMTFLSILLSDLEDAEKTFGTERCVVHPLKNHRYVTTPIMEYAADMQMLLSYYSMSDHEKDQDGKEKKSLETFKAFIPAIEERYPRQSAKLKENLLVLAEKEKEDSRDVNFNALLFGEALGEIFCRDEGSFFASSLWSLGCSLGRFIYILDAWDDRAKDWKNGHYNPFTKEMTQPEVKALLLDSAASASIAFEGLALDEYVSILDNIIYSGMWSKFKGEKK